MTEASKSLARSRNTSDWSTTAAWAASFSASPDTTISGTASSSVALALPTTWYRISGIWPDVAPVPLLDLLQCMKFHLMPSSDSFVSTPLP